MPEGDTLHRAALTLRPILEGKRVSVLELPRAGKRAKQLEGVEIVKVEARGKNLLIHFATDLVLHTHLKMNGIWRAYRPGAERPFESGDIVVALEVDDGGLAVCWRAPVVRFLRTKALAIDPRIATLGPDPIAPAFDYDEALARLRARDGQPLGVALMDQTAIAGIGNVWKSELCFEHALDPFAPVCAFEENELRAVLQTAVRRMRPAVLSGVRPSRVYNRSGKPCFRCGNAIEMKHQGEMRRSTYWCRSCQPERRTRTKNEAFAKQAELERERSSAEPGDNQPH